MSVAAGIAPVGHQLDRPLEVGALVDPRAEQLQLAPEDAVQVDRHRLARGWRPRPAARGRAARGSQRPAPGRCPRPRRRRRRPRRPSTSRRRRPRRQPWDRRSRAPVCLATARRNASGSTTRTSRPRSRATEAMSMPIGPPPTTSTRSPALHAGAAYVVHGDRRRARRARRGPARGPRQAHEQPGGHGPGLLHRPRRVDADEVQVLADVRDARPGRRGTARTSRAA